MCSKILMEVFISFHQTTMHGILTEHSYGVGISFFPSNTVLPMAHVYKFIHSFIYLHFIGSLQGLINTTIRYRISQVTHHALQIKQLSKYIVP
jgi:hypothetical protein